MAAHSSNTPQVRWAVGQQKDMSMDSVFWIASCTKMITGIACMQLVEQGKLELDNVELVEKLAPELKAVQVFENGNLVPKKQGITLRMLLAHTAGFGYSFFNAGLLEWAGAVGLDEGTGSYHDYPEPSNPAQGWGLTFFLHLQDSAVHSKGTAWWAGLPNLFWWADRQRGIGGIIASQIIPFGDPKILGLWGALEAGILQSLEK